MSEGFSNVVPRPLAKMIRKGPANRTIFSVAAAAETKLQRPHQLSLSARSGAVCQGWPKRWAEGRPIRCRRGGGCAFAVRDNNNSSQASEEAGQTALYLPRCGKTEDRR